MKRTIEHVCDVKFDRYTDYIKDVFDIQNPSTSNTKIEYNLSGIDEFDWNIGVILGSSGSGKTSILKDFGQIKGVRMGRHKPLISNFDWLTPSDAALALTSVGLSSIPTWLRPYHVLSNGEKYRAKLAYLLASSKDGDIILIDEFTSVVNRDVAKAMSVSLQKYVRGTNKKIILASCHYDILEWLMPDWTCSPQNGGVLERGDWLRQQRPKIELQISRVEFGAWDIFKEHHYLTQDLNKSFGLLLFEWDNNPIGIVVYKPQATGAVPNGYGLSRTVVLPDYQGMGVGSKISNFTCGILKANGKRVFTKTVNPALGKHREKSSDFRPTSKNKQVRVDSHTDIGRKRLSRSSYCHEYIGESVYGYEGLILPISEMRSNIKSGKILI